MFADIVREWAQSWHVCIWWAASAGVFGIPIHSSSDLLSVRPWAAATAQGTRRNVSAVIIVCTVYTAQCIPHTIKWEIFKWCKFPHISNMYKHSRCPCKYNSLISSPWWWNRHASWVEKFELARVSQGVWLEGPGKFEN